MRAARRFWFQGRQTVSETREGCIGFQIWFPKGKCVVLGLSDFFKKRNLVFGVRVGDAGVSSRELCLVD